METQALSAQIGPTKVVPLEKVRYCLYARKSTESEERQVLSIDSQIKEMLQMAERDGLDIVEIRRESHSAKESGQRPVFKELLEDIRRGRFNGILTWAPDRLSRNAGDLGSLVDLMDQKLLHQIRTYGQTFINSPNEKFLLMILCSQAKLENDNKSVNVKRGLRTRVEMGLWPAPAPTGYLNEKRIDRKGYVLVDPDRAPIIKQIFEKVAYEKWSGRKLYHWLKFDLNFKTAAGNKNLTLSNIYLILQNTFYYGVFEYPKSSGNFYTGKHMPIITKELFDMVQEQTKSQILRTQEPKEFAFTRMMTCGLCGSGICADEKFKKQKNGNVHHYIYYGCAKVRDKNCKCGYIEEKELIKQLTGLLNEVDLDDSGVRLKFEEELHRYNKFNQRVLGTGGTGQYQSINLKDYARYILHDGTNQEKRELLGCFKSRVVLKNKEVSIRCV